MTDTIRTYCRWLARDSATAPPRTKLMRRKHLLAVALTLALSGLAIGKTTYIPIEQRLTPEQRHATGIDTLSPTQLDLLNTLLRDDAEKTAAAAPVAPPVQKTEHVLMGLEEGPIKGRLKGTVSGWEPGTIFELEDGQRWKVLKGNMTLRKPMVSPQILVVPGVAGRWFFQVDEDVPKARVYRIE